MRRLFLLLALLDLGIVGWAFYDEVEARRPWKAVQEDWNEILEARKLPLVPIAIRQVTNPDLGLIDRCQTCHLASTQDGFGPEVPPPFQTHLRRAELLGPHPPEYFGCTTCHQGQGTQTKGVARSDFAHGADDPYWERPLLTGKMVEVSCLDCHEDVPAGAPTLARGKGLFEELGCHGCHSTKFFAPRPSAIGPSLLLVRQKSSASFVEEWLRDPRAIRSDTKMPAFWPEPLEPSTGVAAAEGSESRVRWARERDEEPRAIAAYLASIPASRTLSDFTVDPSLADEGRTLFDRVGCRGCHRLAADEVMPRDGPATIPAELRFGPSLSSVGEKATPEWLAAWLRSPKDVWPKARMPSLRLTEPELARLVAFLVSLRRPGKPPATAAWSAPTEESVQAGKEAIVRLGCVGCHEIPGIEAHGRPGPELESLGDKTRDEISFGDATVDCGVETSTAAPTRLERKPAAHGGSLECYARIKVQTPRFFAGRNVPGLVMPDFGLDDRDARALTVFLLANRQRKIPTSYRARPSERDRALASGEQLITALNCRGCHEIGRTRTTDESGELRYEPIGGHVRWYEAEAALAPPPLTFAGQKFQYEWLWAFLREPPVVRPYLGIRMPSFGLDDSEIDTLARYFAANDEEPYPVQSNEPPKQTEEQRAKAEEFFAALKCVSCHPASGAAQPGTSTADLAPDLALAPKRLKQRWLRAWLEDPQLLQPDTRMPTYFPAEDGAPSREGLPGFFGDDAKAQLDALVGFVLSEKESVRRTATRNSARR
ncbi:MAG: c-type cytochrome [Deltaproteobacteria bacterium]|nr:c-type cytochrome [Deltaproteobacteria bacterium]